MRISRMFLKDDKGVPTENAFVDAGVTEESLLLVCSTRCQRESSFSAAGAALDGAASDCVD